MRHLTRWSCVTMLAVFVMSGPGVSPGRGQAPDTPPAPVLTDQIRQNGPPVERPEDNPGTAPGPGLFYVPGEYYPDRAGVVWREGYWAQEQPGWVWIPDRWVRQSDGWMFQEGTWVRSRQAQAAVARPDAGQGGAAQVEREVVINFPAAGGATVVQDGVTYSLFENVAAPVGFGYPRLGIIPAYTGMPVSGISAYPAFWGPPIGGWGFGGVYGGWGWPGGFGWGLGGFGFGVGLGMGPMMW